MFFFVFVFLFYWVLPTLILRKLFLLLASYVFYAAWDYRFLALIAGCTLVNYYLGSVLANTSQAKTRQWTLILAIIANMGVLAVFKYFNFFADSLYALGNTLGLEASYTALHIVLAGGHQFLSVPNHQLCPSTSTKSVSNRVSG